MRITMKEGTVSKTVIETGLWYIYRYALNKWGSHAADFDTAPLFWYVYTGRASGLFLVKLFNAKPFMIARKLHEGGSYDEAIARVKKYLEFEEG